MNLTECIDLMHRMGAMDDPTYDRVLHKKNILTEADSRLKKVMPIIRKYFSSVLNPEGRVTSEEYYVNNNPDTTWEQYILYNLRHTFGLMSNADVALLPPVAEIAYGECRFDFTDCNNTMVNKLKDFIDLVKKDMPFLETFKKGGVTFEQLDERYGAALDSKARADQEKMDKTEYTRNTNYTIIPISTMDEAYTYGKDSGVDGKGLLCFTTHEAMWEDFTNDGENKCYCILRNDYKDVPCAKGEGYPKDNYGLSMIFVFVSPWGQLTNSNVRWNHGYHDFDAVDNMFSKSEISDIIGQRFDEAFKCEEGDERFEEEVLQNGERNGVVISYDRKYYLMDGNGHLKRNEEGDLLVLDFVDDFIEGFARVRLNGKWNFIDRNGNLLCEQGFDSTGCFSEGFACVKLDGKYNFIDRNGNLLSKQGFNGAYPFTEGFARVRLNGKWNFIDRNGNYLSEQWFDNAGAFSNGFAEVYLNGKCNFIDKDGNLLSKQGFDNEKKFREGFARVILNDKWNFIDKKGNLLSEQGFDNAYAFSEGFAIVYLNGKCNFIDKDGNLLSKQGFDDAYHFSKGFARVKLDGTWYKIDTDGYLF